MTACDSEQQYVLETNTIMNYGLSSQFIKNIYIRVGDTQDFIGLKKNRIVVNITMCGRVKLRQLHCF